MLPFVQEREHQGAAVYDVRPGRATRAACSIGGFEIFAGHPMRVRVHCQSWEDCQKWGAAVGAPW